MSRLEEEAVADAKETIAARIAELDRRIAAREGASGYKQNVLDCKAARAELQRVLDALGAE